MDIEKLRKLVESNGITYDASGADPNDPNGSPLSPPKKAGGDKPCLKGFSACANGGDII